MRKKIEDIFKKLKEEQIVIFTDKNGSQYSVQKIEANRGYFLNEEPKRKKVIEIKELVDIEGKTEGRGRLPNGASSLLDQLEKKIGDDNRCLSLINQLRIAIKYYKKLGE